MLPTVFLSLSGVNVEFVRSVHNNLPDGLAYFYERSFATGERLIEAMEERIDHTQVFVLFASKTALQAWAVQFEIDRARRAYLRRPGFRCFVFSVSADVKFSDLPAWLQEFWVGGAGQTARDIARYLRGILAQIAQASETALAPIGRGALVDKARREFHAAAFTHKVAPNAFIFAGHAGIGRRTLERLFIGSVFPAMPTITFGPEFELAPFADLADVYRGLRREVEEHFSIERFEQDLQAFSKLSIEEQITEILTSIKHFSDLGQAVTIVVGHGLYEDHGDLKAWVKALLNGASSQPDAKICLVSNSNCGFVISTHIQTLNRCTSARLMTQTLGR